MAYLWRPGFKFCCHITGRVTVAVSPKVAEVLCFSVHYIIKVLLPPLEFGGLKYTTEGLPWWRSG